MTSLRMRFFVIVWALVVVGLVGLGTLLGRWSVVAIDQVSTEAALERQFDRTDRAVLDRVLLAPTRDSTGLSRVLAEATRDDSLVFGAFLADRDGRVIASALPALEPGALTVKPDGEFDLRRETVSEGRRAAVRIVGNGRLVDPRDTVNPRYLVVIPSVAGLHESAPVTASGGDLLTRRIVLAVLIGSVLAALVTLAISGPLLGRVGELSRAVARLGRGDLAARVPVRGGDEIAHLGGAFNAMADDLERAESQRRQMVTDVAHELRTPLTNITALLEAVEDGLRAPDAETIAVLREEAGLLAGLIDDLRDLSLAESGHLQLTVEPIDVVDVVRRAVDGFDRRHGIIVDMPEPPVLVRVDARRLGQVLRNLIQNAVTHSPEPGSVVVTLSESRTAPSVPSVASLPQGDRRMNTITIADRGPGITADQLDRIWERFYRVDSSRTRATGGMGLGLPVARQLVEAMGGAIRVTSKVGQGSVFEVSLG
jgi:two-component system sensor histidine kinase BaeS